MMRTNPGTRRGMKVFTTEELKNHKGESGATTLVAANGKVYDVSESKKWKQGLHMNRHRAGTDLTNALSAAPHGIEVLERFPVVGSLKPPAQEVFPGARGKVESFLVRHPFFRRHPHPSIVHLPVGLLVTAPVLLFVSLATDSPRTEWAAACCLLAALVSMPGAMVTGYFAWWVNYECAESRIISAKRRLAWISLVVAAAAVAVRASLADPLMLSDFRVIVYVAAVICLSVLVGLLGFLGGKLTFPYE